MRSTENNKNNNNKKILKQAATAHPQIKQTNKNPSMENNQMCVLSQKKKKCKKKNIN